MCCSVWSCLAGLCPAVLMSPVERRFRTGGVPRASTMRPNSCWAVLQASVLVLVLLSMDADSQESGCRSKIKVRHNTVYEASHGKYLKIRCDFVFCNSSPPQITWYKLGKNNVDPITCNKTTRIQTENETHPNSTGTSYLIFQNILTSDSGLYRCQDRGSVGHSINISVSGHVELTTVTSQNETNSTLPPDPDLMHTLWLYLYLAAGITVFVIIVIIISVVSMRGCKGESRKEKQTKHQYYMEIPMSQQPPSHPGPQRPPRGRPSSGHVLSSGGPDYIYDNAPSHRPGRKNPAPLEPDQVPVSAGGAHVYGKKKEVKGKMKAAQKEEEEEESHVHYAALNHHMLSGTSAQPARPNEDSSEYAAIRV